MTKKSKINFLRYQVLDLHSHYLGKLGSGITDWAATSVAQLGARQRQKAAEKRWGIGLLDSNFSPLKTLSVFLYHRNTHERFLKQADALRHKPSLWL